MFIMPVRFIVQLDLYYKFICVGNGATKIQQRWNKGDINSFKRHI